MAAYDNVSLGNAPGAASYAGPLMNFSALSELPAAYQQGNQDARTRALQTAFKGGLPRIGNDPNGELDIKAMSETLAKLGGAESAMPLINMDLTQKQSANLAAAMRNNPVPSTGTPETYGAPPQQQRTPVYVPPTGIPAADSGADTQRQQDQNGPITPQRLAKVQSQEPSNTGYNPGAERVTGAAPDGGQNTLRGLAISAYGDKADAATLNLQKAFNIANPDAVLDPQQMATIQRAIGGQRLAQGEGQPLVGAGPKGNQPAGDPLGMYASVIDANENRANAIRAALAGAPNISADQKAPLEKEAEASNARAKQFREHALANRDLTPDQKAYIMGRNPGEGFTAFQARAAGEKKTAEVAAENKAMTPEMKNAQSVGQDVATFKRNEAADKLEVERYSKLYSGIQAAARSASDMRPHLDLMNSFVNNPNFYSGPGEGINLYYKRVLANIPPSLGGDPNAAVPQEGMRKVLAANILNQVDQLKAMSAEMGSGSSRIFQSQIGLMNDAAQKPDNSPAAIRFLTELGIRAANHAEALADIASKYKGSRLDPQFEIALRKYEKDHPMFTHQELADTRLIAPPVAPATLRSAADVAAWTQKAGLKRGDPFKLPDGSPGWAQ